MKPGRIPELDGIRGVAILLVLAGHTVQNYQPLAEPVRRWLLVFANPGAGVRLFFVLSGYLITQLLLEEQAATATISVRRFYGRRILRIFPAFYAYLLAVLAVNAFRSSDLAPGAWIAAGTFTWNYAFFWTSAPPVIYWDLGHLWTLAVEQQFYLVWPLLLLWLGPRRGLWLAIALIAWCPLARVATYFLFPAQRGYVGMMFHTAADSLMAGCAAAILVQSGSLRIAMRHRGSAAALAATIWLLLMSPLLGSALRGFPVAAGITLDALAAGWLIAWVHHAPSRTIGTCLGRGLLPALGIISYSLYLWQQIFLSPTGGLNSGHIVLPWLGAITAAVISYWLVEKPFLRFKSRLKSPRLLVSEPST